MKPCLLLLQLSFGENAGISELEKLHRLAFDLGGISRRVPARGLGIAANAIYVGHSFASIRPNFLRPAVGIGASMPEEQERSI